MSVINFKSPSKKIVRKSLQNILVKDYMSKEVITFHKSDSIFEVKRILLEKKISGAPIIDKSGKLIGIISETDLMKQIVDSRYYNMPMSKTTVSKYMTENVDSISPNETIFDAAEKFLRLKRKRFPVIVSNKILGIISRVDIIAAALNIRSSFY
ncbi:MAG: CBS domain-containing protein [Flavobacteriaceae bacterium]|jgi:CBS domain-containing protein|nr:CBS domain-containing protein [Flavobacteriaceae bacterium]